jgi:hypothetical protein
LPSSSPPMAVAPVCVFIIIVARRIFIFVAADESSRELAWVPPRDLVRRPARSRRPRSPVLMSRPSASSSSSRLLRRPARSPATPTHRARLRRCPTPAPPSVPARPRWLRLSPVAPCSPGKQPQKPNAACEASTEGECCRHAWPPDWPAL